MQAHGTRAHRRIALASAVVALAIVLAGGNEAQAFKFFGGRGGGGKKPPQRPHNQNHLRKNPAKAASGNQALRTRQSNVQPPQWVSAGARGARAGRGAPTIGGNRVQAHVGRPRGMVQIAPHRSAAPANTQWTAPLRQQTAGYKLYGKGVVTPNRSAASSSSGVPGPPIRKTNHYDRVPTPDPSRPGLEARKAAANPSVMGKLPDMKLLRREPINYTKLPTDAARSNLGAGGRPIYSKLPGNDGRVPPPSGGVDAALARSRARMGNVPVNRGVQPPTEASPRPANIMMKPMLISKSGSGAEYRNRYGSPRDMMEAQGATAKRAAEQRKAHLASLPSRPLPGGLQRAVNSSWQASKPLYGLRMPSLNGTPVSRANAQNFEREYSRILAKTTVTEPKRGAAYKKP